MKESNFKGIWIPKEILLNSELTDKEKIVLSIAISFSEDNKTCYVGNRYLSKLLNVTQNRASKIVSALQDKGYVDIQMDYYEDKKSIKNRRIILKDKTTQDIVKNNNRYSCFGQEGIVNKDNMYSLLEQWGIVPKGKYIKNNNKKDNKKIYNKEYDFQKPFFENKEDYEKLYDNWYLNKFV